MAKHRRHSHRRKLYKRPGFYVLLISVLFAAMGIYWLFRFQILPSVLLAVFIICEAVFLFILWYLLLYRHRRWMKILGYILAACLIVVNCVESYYMYVTWSAIEKMAAPEQQTGDYVELYVLKDSVIHSAADLSDRKIGILASMDEEQAKLMTDWLDSEQVHYELVPYDSSLEMARNLKGAVIDGIILYQPYLSIIESYEGMDQFSRDIRSIHQIACKNIPFGKADEVDVTKNPFTILISGIDTYGEIGASGRSDVNLLMTVNPVSRQILLISIPRDYYVEMACEEGSGCPAGQRDKLTHSGIYGIQATEKTLENLLDLTINYDVRVNFSTVIRVIDELGGIEVNNVDSFTIGEYSFEPGMIHMNGDQALAFSRERYSFKEGDRERGRNQMRVVQGIIQKALSPEILANYQGILNAVSSSIQMNLSADDIAKLVNIQLSKPSSWQIYTYSLNGYDANDYAPSQGDNAYVMLPNDQSLTQAKQDIQAVENGEKPLYVQ